MFCYLDNNEKNFTYVQAYFECANNCQKFLSKDLEIQKKEIIEHLKRNGYSEDEISEQNSWVSNNAKKFREYLNTIKMIFCVLYCTGKNNISWEEFLCISQNFNKIKDDMDVSICK